MEGITLRITVVEAGDDWVLLCDSPFGRSSARLPEPFSPEELTTALRDLENANLRSAAKLISRKGTSPELTARQFGRQLVDLLFTGQANILFDRCRAQARQRRVPLRLLLETTGPTVSRIPWEFVTDPGTRDDYLVLRVPVARTLRLAEPVAPLAVQPPLRVLGVHARTDDLPQLDFEEERRRIAAAFEQVSSELVEVTWLDADRWKSVNDTLGRGGWHVLHFVGHGGFSTETGAGYLELAGEDGSARQFSSLDVARAISRSPDLRLIVLNSCDSATGAGTEFSSTAEKLMREGVPAVVAMQYEITDAAALAFSAAFYEAVARNTPVDQAVTFARETVRVSMGSLEWATPVLFLASDETSIFDVQHAPAPRATPQRAASPPAPRVPPPGPRAAVEPAPGRVPSAAQANRAAPAPADTPARDWSSALKERLETTLGRFQQGSSSAAPRASQAPPRATATSSFPQPQARPDPAAGSAPSGSAPTAGETRTAMSVSAAGLVALATYGGGIRAWSLEEHAWRARCSLPAGIRAHLVAWHPSGRYVASANSDGTVAVWDLERETRVRLMSPGCGRVGALEFSENGKWLALTGADRTVQVYDSKGVRVRRTALPPADHGPAGWSRGERPLGPVAFAAWDKNLVVATNDGRVCRLDVRGVVAASWPHDADVVALVVHSDLLATCSADDRLRLWDWGGRLLWRQDVVRPRLLACDPAGRLAVASAGGVLQLWDLSGEELGATALDAEPVGLGFWEGAVVTGEAAGPIRVWRP